MWQLNVEAVSGGNGRHGPACTRKPPSAILIAVPYLPDLVVQVYSIKQMHAVVDNVEPASDQPTCPCKAQKLRRHARGVGTYSQYMGQDVLVGGPVVKTP